MNPPLLLLHGFTGSAQTMAGIAATQKTRETICADLIGHGKNPVPASFRRYKFTAQRRQISKIIESMDASRVHLLGYSLGGRIALDFSLKNQEKVASLILISSTAGLKSRNQRKARKSQDLSLAKSILENKKDGLAQKDSLAEFVRDWMSQPLFASQSRLGQKYMEDAYNQRMQCSPLGLANTLKGAGLGSMKPLWGKLHKLKIPCLIVTGSEDVKFSDLGEKLQTEIRTSVLIKIGETGHTPHLEKPALTGGLISQFLNYSDSLLLNHPDSL